MSPVSPVSPGGVSPTASLVVGIDVGGTFTDVVALDETSRTCSVAKVASTRAREAEGFLSGVRAAVGERGIDGVAVIIHGTTVGTNALLERKGAVTGIITTAGFGDVLEMRRRDRPATWGLWGDFHPVVPRDLRVEVAERTLADGTIETTVEPGDVVAAAQTLLARGAVAVAVTFLHSYAEPTNEAVAAAALRAMWPNEHVSISSEILPEIREFERTSTTTLNAYLQPVVGNYLAELESGLAAAGFAGRFLVVQSNGGVMSVAAARRFPIRTALSGPAAGVIAAERIAVAAGHPNVVTGDMGGTSFDVAVIDGGRSVLCAQSTVDFGLVIRSPMIEVTTIGAGGGSIAWVDRGGLLRIGPESAGGMPGPVCYGQGNTRPTVTDANVVLGRINAERPIGERARLDVAAARAAIVEHVGTPLGLDVDQAAEAIMRVAESRMAGALRLVSIERGHDPSTFWMLPFGGAGGLHCCAFVRDLHLAGALVPPRPGVISALGCVIADVRVDAVRTIAQPLATLDLARMRARLAEAVDHALEAVTATEVLIDRVDVQLELEMSYVGQTHTVAVALPTVQPGAVDGAMIRAAFEQTYLATYGRLLDGIAVRVMTLRAAVIGRRPAFDLATLAPSSTLDTAAARRGSRPVFFAGAWHDTAVWDRLGLAPGAVVDGPAILEQPDATTVVEPGFRATVDALGNLEVVLVE